MNLLFTAIHVSLLHSLNTVFRQNYRSFKRDSNADSLVSPNAW